MTMRGHLDWHASSNGKKYLSASMKLVFDLIGGKVLEPDLPSPLGGLGRNNIEKKEEKKKRDRDSEINTVITWSSLSTGVTRKEARFKNQPDTLTLPFDIQAWVTVRGKGSAKSGMFLCTEQTLLVHSCNRTLNVLNLKTSRPAYCSSGKMQTNKIFITLNLM